MTEAKVQKVVFSLPYREGMDVLTGFVKKSEGTSKTYPEERTFAQFSFPLDNSIEVAEKDALAAGYKVLRQNRQRSLKLGEYAKQFGIAALGAAGGITATDRKLIQAMGELSTNFAKIAVAFTKRTGKAITMAEIQEILPA